MKKMFELWKSKFYCKCKSDVKLVLTRIDIIKKKRNAMQKYLRNDVVDLLRSGLDINAFGRAGGLLVELKRTECYDFIEQCALRVSDNLTVMNKQKECPEECKEAISCLIFAAARFADLPELRDLRTIFTERYGNSLDFNVNKEFVEKMKSGIPSKDEKLRLLQDIAQESDIEWDSKALENKLYNEATRKEDHATEINDGQDTLPEGADESIQERDVLAKGSLPVLPVKDIPVDTIKKTKEEEHEYRPLKYNAIPPPYTIPEENKAKSSFTYSTNNSLERSNPGEKDYDAKENKTIPKSVRRRNVRPPLSAVSSKGNEQEKTTDINKEKAAPSQRILKFFDGGGYERDEEERMMDKLSRHYSSKNEPRENINSDSLKEPVKSRNKDIKTRSSSLPDESVSPSGTPKRHTRATSFQPELLNGNNVHVHPKLPDYDDFLARLEALRRKSEE